MEKTFKHTEVEARLLKKWEEKNSYIRGQIPSACGYAACTTAWQNLPAPSRGAFERGERRRSGRVKNSNEFSRNLVNPDEFLRILTKSSF